MSVLIDTTSEIVQYLNETLCPSVWIDADTDLLAEGIVDSLMIMELVEHMQSTYGIGVESEAIVPRNFRSARTISGLIASRLKTVPSASR